MHLFTGSFKFRFINKYETSNLNQNLIKCNTLAIIHNTLRKISNNVSITSAHSYTHIVLLHIIFYELCSGYH